jgi:hypothetical protein
MVLPSACSGGSDGDSDAALAADARAMDGGSDAGAARILEMDPASHDFGDAPVGGTSATLVVTVSNPGSGASGPLELAVPADFAVSDDACSGHILAGGTSCTFSLAFVPAAEGHVSDSVRATASPGGTATMAVEGQGQPPGALVITPTSHDFGLVELGDASSATPTTFTVANGGAGPSGAVNLVLGGSQAASFAITGGSCAGTILAAGSSCQVEVTFVPDADGRRSASLSAQASPGGTAVASLVGRARTPARLILGPDPVAFGLVEVGTDSPTVAFMVTNSGEEGTGALSVALSGAGYALTADACSGQALEGHASCALSLRLHPTTLGDAPGTLTVSASPGGSDTSMLSATAVTPAQVVVSPESVDLGSALVGSAGGDRTMTVSNQGGLPTGPLTVSSSGDTSDLQMVSSTCPTTLAAGASCAVVVRLVPTSRGDKHLTLTASASPGGSDDSQLFGSALAPALLSIEPDSHDYGVVVVGASSSSLGELFTVTNTGDVASGPASLSLGNSDADDFAIVTSSCDGILAPGATCTARVRFAPQSPGAKVASVEVTASPGGTALAELKGTGLAASQLKLSPASHDFGAVMSGMSSATFDFLLENLGSQSADSLAISLDGSGATQFTIDGGSCGAQLAAGASCIITVRFTPDSTGSKNAALVVMANPGGVAISGLLGLAN